MKTIDFVKQYLPDARKCEQDTGINAAAILTQAAIESGWGEHIPANSNEFFGQKASISTPKANEILIRTTEILRNPDVKFPVIHSIIPFVQNGIKYFKYDCEDYFMQYSTPYDAFVDHCHFIMSNSRYTTALIYKRDPARFLQEVAKAGYATGLSYETLCSQVLNSILTIIKNNNL